jgi:hypothetical protein
MCMYGMYMCIHVCMCVCTCVFAHVVCGVPSICCSHPPWVPALRITHALVENLFPFLYSLSPSSSSDEAHNAPDAEASDKSSGHDIKLSLQIWFHQNPTVLQWEQFKASSSTNIWTPVRKDTVVHLSFWKLISEKSSCLHRWGWTKRRRLHLQSPGSTEPLQMEDRVCQWQTGSSLTGFQRVPVNSLVNQKMLLFLDQYSFLLSEVSFQHTVLIKENSGNHVALLQSIYVSN